MKFNFLELYFRSTYQIVDVFRMFGKEQAYNDSLKGIFPNMMKTMIKCRDFIGFLEILNQNRE